MDDNYDELDEYYDFFKETFNIDLNKMSDDEALKVIDEVNNVLDKRLKEEEIKKQQLKDIYNGKINVLHYLSEQLVELENN